MSVLSNMDRTFNLSVRCLSVRWGVITTNACILASLTWCDALCVSIATCDALCGEIYEEMVWCVIMWGTCGDGDALCGEMYDVM